MAFVGIALGVGTAVGLGTGAAAIIGGGALLGAGAGGLYSAITGDGDVLNSMLTGGLIGGAGAFGLSSAGVGAAAGAAAPAAVSTTTPALLAPLAGEVGGTAGSAAVTPALTGGKALQYGLAGMGALSLLGNKNKGPGASPDPGMIRPYTYSSKLKEPTGAYPSPYATSSYDAQGNPILDTRERDYFDQSFVAGEPYKAAQGGLMGAESAESMSQNSPRFNEGGSVDSRNLINLLDQIKKTSSITPSFSVNSLQQPSTGNEDFDALQRSNVPQGIMARAGVNRANSDGSSFNAGISGMGMDIPGQGIMTKPGALDVGYRSNTDPSKTSFNVNAMQSLNPIPGKGYPRGINANVRIPFNQGGITNLAMGGMAMGGQSGQMYPQSMQEHTNFAQSTQYPTSAQQVNSYEPMLNPLTGNLDSQSMAAGGAVSNMATIDNYIAQYQSDPATVIAKARSGDYNAMIAMNKIKSTPNQNYAQGGISNLGIYSDGGQLLKGPGDGVSDSIPAIIGEKQPARLAEGEFVVPARIVSELGNGSTDAGAKRLYAMMDKIQSGRKKTVGKNQVAKNTNAKKYLPV